MIDYKKKYLTKQIITYIGNKRKLLSFINEGIEEIKKDLNKQFISILDGFSGSGIVSRFFKEYIASELYVNDWEDYSLPINQCYLSNRSTVDINSIRDIINQLNKERTYKGIITNNYAPKDDLNITSKDRVFYTITNAMIIDSIRLKIDDYEEKYRPYLLAPLLSEASIHVNTSGVFRGFYKNNQGIGQFGSSKEYHLQRIKGEINLSIPVLSDREILYTIYKDDIINVVKQIPEIDVAYFDPPYNKHPYGSNYFMLNIIVNNKILGNQSKISGIPNDWKRSTYNKYKEAISSLRELIKETPAKYILISYNNQGIISIEEFKNIMKEYGDLRILTKNYISFKGGRNNGKTNKVNELLFMLKKMDKWKMKEVKPITLF